MPETQNLFPDHTAPVPTGMMVLFVKPGTKLTPAQRSFKQLIGNIEAVEKRLQEIAALLDVFRPLSIKKLRPLFDERDLLNRDMVRLLDEQLLRKGWTANQRETMREIACTLAQQLFGSVFNEEMEAIFERHSDAPKSDPADEASAEFEAHIENLFGVELDTVDGEVRSRDEILQEAIRKMEQREQEQSEHAKARAASKRGGKKSIRQTKAEQQTVDAGKLLKEVYRKLTSALHPDREPDTAKRARKTALMSEVNKAYESGNLLKLLQMQLQTVNVNSLAAVTLADEKLQLINYTLTQQYRELELECQQLDLIVREEFQLAHYGALTAVIIQKALNVAAAETRADIKIMRRDLAAMNTSDAQLKSWLKSQRQLMKEDEQFDFAMMQATLGRRRR